MCDSSDSSDISEKLKTNLTSLNIPTNPFICTIEQQNSTKFVGILHTLDVGCLLTLAKPHSAGIADITHRLLFKHYVSDTRYFSLFGMDWDLSGFHGNAY